MAAITLSKFRLISQLSEEMLPREQAIQALCAGSGAARRIAGREFGHAIEYAEQISATADVLIKIFRHRLPSSGKVLIGGTNIVALTGVLNYTTIDEDSIKIAAVTLADRIKFGRSSSRA